MKCLLIITIIALFASCKPSHQEIEQIEFEAEACEGECPVFSMIINKNGTAQFDAKLFNEKQGHFVTIIKKLQFDSLINLIENADLLSLKDEYKILPPDHPTCHLTVRFKDRQAKTIKDYGPSGPEELEKIYTMVLSLRESQDWK